MRLIDAIIIIIDWRIIPNQFVLDDLVETTIHVHGVHEEG